MNKGTIILVPFPFADFSVIKVRPVYDIEMKLKILLKIKSLI